MVIVTVREIFVPLGQKNIKTEWTLWNCQSAKQQWSHNLCKNINMYIQFKLASLTDKVLRTGTPSYLSERLHPYVPSRTLQSSSSANLYVPRTNQHFGSRSFYTAAATVWNSLPSIFVRLKPAILSKNILKPIFSSLLLIAPIATSKAGMVCLPVKLCDPCLSALRALYKCSSFPFLSFVQRL